MTDIPKKVFISYSHDSQEHKDFVRSIANQLRVDGVEAHIDQYINGFPPEGFIHWMENQIEAADFVLVVCTPTYLNRYRGNDQQNGRGVTFEGVVIFQSLYDTFYKNTKFVPIISNEGSIDNVPLPLKQYTCYRLPAEYDNLYRYLTEQPAYALPPLGTKKVLPPLDPKSTITLTPSQTTSNAQATSTLDILHTERKTRLEEKLRLLYEQCDYETRVDEKLLLKVKIKNTEIELQELLGSQKKINLNNITTVVGDFFGRQTELEILHNAWINNNNCIIQFTALGGTGKTKLIDYWIDQTQPYHLIAWSFYSQGSSEDKQTSATPFFTEAFKILKATQIQFNSEEEKGRYLAELLQKQKIILILDGLEPLQHAGNGMRGDLKDRALHQLLKSLLNQDQCLCIITTRIEIFELKNKPYVLTKKLENLEPSDAVKLLTSWGVVGSDKEFMSAVQEYNCHALALHLLGNAIVTYLEKDICKRDTLTELIDEYDENGRHAYKVMQAYQIWLKDTPELKLLYILGLFDHPLDREVLQMLWDAQIPELTQDIPLKAWQVAIRDLKEKHHILSEHNISKELECHPLTREYFGNQLRHKFFSSWIEGHEKLCDYYQKITKNPCPSDLTEMNNLFKAIAHGCLSNQYDFAWKELYLKRIEQINLNEDQYSQYPQNTYKLGLIQDSLACLSSFFEHPWHILKKQLPEYMKGSISNRVGLYLDAMCRTSEAIDAYKLSSQEYMKISDLENYIINSCELIALFLAIGKTNEALGRIAYCIEIIKDVSDWQIQIITLCSYGRLLHQINEIQEAKTHFEKAEKIQHINQGQPFLYGMQGSYYNELLLDLNKTNVVKQRINRNLKAFGQEYHNYSKIGEYLILTKIFIKEKNFNMAKNNLHKLEKLIYESGLFQYLPVFYLIKSGFYRQNLNFYKAHKVLEQALDIIEPARLKLNLADYYLEKTRIYIAEQKKYDAQFHYQKANSLINEISYHRRDGELVNLEKQLKL